MIIKQKQPVGILNDFVIINYIRADYFFPFHALLWISKIHLLDIKRHFFTMKVFNEKTGS